MRGLEIGPSFNPCLPKREGWSVETIDHLSRDGLVEKYSNPAFGVNVENIESVDWVWNGEPLEQLLGETRHATYDYIVASHVIEHIPDLLGFFKSAETLLKIGGVLSLVVPDKRYCFDVLKPPSLTPDLIEAHESKHRKHSKKTVSSYFGYSSQIDGRSDWSPASSEGDLRLILPLSEMKSAMERYGEPDQDYFDCHAWYFVPSSFQLVLLELRALGYTNFRTLRTFEPEGCEFYITLQKSGTFEARAIGEELEAQRLRLLKATMLELSHALP